MRNTLRSLALGVVMLSLSGFPALADRPVELAPGAIFSVTQAGCGFAGCTFDETTFFHNGLWTRVTNTLPEDCIGTKDERTTVSERHALRDVQKVLRPWAKLNAAFVPPGGADTQEFSIRTVHGTISWSSGAEDPASGSGMPPEVADAINMIWPVVRAATERPCFGR